MLHTTCQLTSDPAVNGNVVVSLVSAHASSGDKHDLLLLKSDSY